MKASIIILDFEKSTRVLENVESIQKQSVDFPFEIIIAVNAATPAKRERLAPLEKFENVKLLLNEENLGYPRGVNAAVARAKGEILFIVNPDIVWREPDTLRKLVAKIEADARLGVLAPRQINDPGGELARTARAFPQLGIQIARRTWLRRLPGIREKVAADELRHRDLTRPQKVDWIQSSFWVARKDFWEELGGLDERFFLFMSDPDFCWRTWERGREVLYFPEASVNADGVRASAGGFFDFFRKWTLRQHLRDAWKYHRKHRGKKHPRKS